MDWPVLVKLSNYLDGKLGNLRTVLIKMKQLKHMPTNKQKVQHHPYHRIFFPQVNANQPCASNIMRNMATAQTWLSNNRCDLS